MWSTRKRDSTVPGIRSCLVHVPLGFSLSSSVGRARLLRAEDRGSIPLSGSWMLGLRERQT